METNIPNEKPAGGRNAAWLVLCFAAGAAATLIWPVYFVLPALWTAAMLQKKPVWLAAAIAVMLAAAYFLWDGWLTAVCLTALAALPALAMRIMQKRGIGNVYTAAVMAGLTLLSLYGLVCLPGVLSGEGAFGPIQREFSTAIDGVRQALLMLPDAPENVMTLWSEYLDLFEESVSALIVPSLCGVSCVLALSNLLFFRLYARKRNLGLQPMRRFCDWSIPQSLTGGLALLLIAALVASFTEWEFAAGFTATANVIVGFPLIVQGLSTLDFFMGRSRRAALVRTLVYIGIGLMFSLVQSALMLFGCCEQIFHVRERVRAFAAQRPR